MVNYNAFILLINIYIVATLRYPINKNISNSEIGNIKTILIKSKESYLNYILNQKYVISLTEFSIKENESKIISIFNKLSSYKILKDWNFLQIQCYEQNDLCNLLSINITNKLLPSIKIYIKSQEIKTSNIMLNFDISDFLEFLLKLSSNSIIEIKNNDINSFYEKYNTYSPIVYYDEKNSEFISCINLLAKKQYYPYYYFGTISINTNLKSKKKEKILFDNDKMPISLTWEGDCDDVDNFLGNNKFPLMSKVDKELIHQLIVNPKILVVLIGYISNNDAINKFINNEFKNMAYMHRDLIFAYDFYNEFKEDNFFVNKTKFKFISKDHNNMKVLFYDFLNELYYIHPIVYKINATNTDFIYSRINNLMNLYQKLPFTCGSVYLDIAKKYGIFKFFTDKNKMIALASTFAIIVLGFLYLCFYGKSR